MATVNDPVFVDGTFQATNIAVGRISVPVSGTPNPASVPVTYPALSGSGAVYAQVTAYTADPRGRTGPTNGVNNVSVWDVTATGMTIYLHRTNNVATTVYWMVMRSP